MGVGHLNRGLFEAHGIDEGGEPERGIGGHDVMWFAVRDLAFGPTDFPHPEVPESIARPESDASRIPEIGRSHERLIDFLCNLLLIEFRAERIFSLTESLLRDPERAVELGARGRDAVRRGFTSAHMAQNVAALCRDLAATRAT